MPAGSKRIEFRINRLVEEFLSALLLIDIKNIFTKKIDGKIIAIFSLRLTENGNMFCGKQGRLQIQRVIQ